MPHLAFLHGNVAAGYCKVDNAIGYTGQMCKCGNLLQPIKLLYPIKKKNYNSIPAISKAWKTLQNALKEAYMITIFGYSAPKSDVEAMTLLKEAWGTPHDRKLEQIEIIDLRSRADIINSWSEFIYENHYSYHTHYFETSLGRFPRRSCEATFDMLMNSTFLDGNKGFKETMNFTDIQNLIYPLIKDETSAKATGNMLLNPYI